MKKPELTDAGWLGIHRCEIASHHPGVVVFVVVLSTNRKQSEMDFHPLWKDAHPDIPFLPSAAPPPGVHSRGTPHALVMRPADPDRASPGI